MFFLEELGQKLKEAREKIGVSIEEAAEDLNIRHSQLENIEAGNIKAFKDVFYLKYFIRDYAKYLGLNYEELVDEFNEFLFDYTSKIPVDVIKTTNEQPKPEEKKKIISPYTLERKRPLIISSRFIYTAIVILIIIILYLLINYYGTDEFKEVTINSNNVIAWLEV